MQLDEISNLKQSCPSLLSDLLKTIASVDNKLDIASGLDLAADGGLVESVSANGASENSIKKASGPGRNMYPKVKVRVEEDEASRYDYEKISLQSLKAFEWVSLQSSSSSDESPRSVVRIPQSGISRSPPPSFLEPKGTNKKASAGEKPKNVRANSAPRPRAVLSSPVNDGIIGSKSQARGGLLSGQKSYNPIQNKHTQRKIFPRSVATEAFTPTKRSKQEQVEPQNNSRAKGGVGVADSNHRRKIALPTDRNKLFDGVT